MKLNDIYEITLPRCNHEGICDCLINQTHVFVRGGIEKEQVKIQLTKKIKEGYIAQIIQIIKPSIFRIQNNCPHINCGGCQYNHMTYQASVQLKYNQMISLFSKENIYVHPLVEAKHPRQYRNKAIFTFQKNKKDVLFGFYQENSHYVEDIKTCLNHDDFTNQIFAFIKRLVIAYKIEPFDEDKGSGIFRHVLIRRAFATNQTLVCLVVSKPFKGSSNFVKEMIEKLPEITTVVMNINPRKTSVVLGNQEKVLYGKGYIVDKLCGCTYKLTATTFYQINHDQTELLYQKAIELCNPHPNDTVYDMYCGIGTIGMSLAPQVKQVIGVEINQRSITDATNNAKMNHIQNARFINEDATAFMKKEALKKPKTDIIIMDPPRSGSTPVFIAACANLKPKKILYISCNPLTQVRDLQEFKKYGYTAKEVFPFDLFPYSSHVETVLLMSKKNS